MLRGLSCLRRLKLGLSWSPLWCNCSPVILLSFLSLFFLKFYLGQWDWFKQQHECSTGSLVCQTPEQKLSNLFLGAVLIVGLEQVKGLSVLVHSGNFKRRPNHLLCRCSWIKPADIVNIWFLNSQKPLLGFSKPRWWFIVFFCIILVSIGPKYEVLEKAQQVHYSNLQKCTFV